MLSQLYGDLGIHQRVCNTRLPLETWTVEVQRMFLPFQDHRLYPHRKANEHNESPLVV